MIKCLVTTNWSARYEAIRAVKTRFQKVFQALDLLTPASENLQTRGYVQIILLSIENFSFASHLFFWEKILRQINRIQKKIQEPGFSLDVSAIHMDATKIFFDQNRHRLVFELVNQSKTKCKEMEISIEKRIRRKRKLSGENEDYICQTLVQEIKRNLYKCYDPLVNELEARFDSMSHL